MDRRAEARYPRAMRWPAVVLVMVPACYAPAVPAGAPCDVDVDNCPAGQRCELATGGAFCVASLQSPDAATVPGDSASLDTAPGCYGVGILHDMCVMPAPMADLTISGNRTINTAMVGSPNCDEIIAQPGGGASLCLVAARSITIDVAATLIGVGPNPLVLLATDAITVDGTLDVASRLGSMSPGAGADTTCASASGGNATATDGAGGGGAGGSFGAAGGRGGSGRTPDSPTPGGTAGPAQAANTLRGGCAGGTGGKADGGGGDGAAGAGGGAIYLIAGTSLTITGVINASGSGGGQGTDGNFASGGAGGGGSGGMIGLDAPAITSTGEIFANGGSGGGGGGDDPSRNGTPGRTPTAAVTAAPGGAGGGGGGGDGGNGSVLTSPPTAGDNGTNPYCGGGGGGGGAGVIRVFGVSASSLGGEISPPPT